MMNQEMIEYIKKSQAEGMHLDVIRNSLKTGGWTDKDIDEAFHAIMNPPASEIPRAPGVPIAPSISSVSNQNISTGMPQSGFDSTANFQLPKRKVWPMVVLVVIILLLGGTSFAYYKGFFPLPSFISNIFNKPPYNEDNLISGLAFKIAQIKTTTYNTSLEFNVGARDPNATELVLPDQKNEPASKSYAGFFPERLSLTNNIITDLDLSHSADPSWKIQASTIGEFGDFYYQISADVLKKEGNLYIKINNLPLILDFFPLPKSQWFLVNFDTLTSIFGENSVKADISQLQKDTNMSQKELQENIKMFQDEYKNAFTNLSGIVKKTILLADQKKLLAFKQQPFLDTSTNKNLYRYDLEIRPGTLEPYLKELLQYLWTEEYKLGPKELEEAMKELSTEKSKTIIDYLEKNTSIILWVDINGFPESFKTKSRVVSNTEDPNLKDKQLNFVATIYLNKINEPVNIETPADAKDLFQFLFDYFEATRINTLNSLIKSKIMSLRPIFVRYQDKNGNYGPKTSGSCEFSKGVFADAEISYAISDIKSLLSKNEIQEKPICYSSGQEFAISTPILNDGDGQKYYCIDSSERQGEFHSQISGPSCPSF